MASRAENDLNKQLWAEKKLHSSEHKIKNKIKKTAHLPSVSPNTGNKKETVLAFFAEAKYSSRRPQKLLAGFQKQL